MKQEAAVFAFAVLIGVLVSSNPFSALEDISFEKQVIDCREQRYECNTTGVSNINGMLETCQGSWRQGAPKSELNCTFAQESAEEVSLISDGANYVNFKKSDEELEKTVYEETSYSPWDLEITPSGTRIWTSRKGGLMMREDGETLLIEKINVTFEGENGLLGLAVDPEFEENNYVYLYYTFNRSNEETILDDKYLYENRISRFELTNNSLRNEKKLIEVPGSYYHSGGRLEFGPDGKLYITTGEAYMEYEAANPDFLGGKVLRINSDGTIPDDNPFNGSATYSMGHRNPQGIAWNPETGTLYQSEHGPWRYDELNRIEPGENYGWAYEKCNKRFKKSISYWDDLPVPDVYDETIGPVICWNNFTMAPSGMTFVNDTESPWHGDLFIAGLRGDHIARIEFQDDQIVDREVFYVSREETGVSLRMRDVEYFNGSLHVIGDRRGMVRIAPE